MMKNTIIFALSMNKRLTEKIAEILNIDVGKVDIEKFADGEVLPRNLSNVKGKDVYICQSTCNPGEENIFEILLFADALKNSEAKSVNLIVPYFGYARQDRVARSGEPISAKVVASLFQAVGIEKIITLDLHTQQIQGFFSCPVINLEPTELFGEYMAQYMSDIGVNHKDVVVVAPDHGSALRARDLGSMFNGASIAFIDKRRPAPNTSEVINVIGDVKDKVCVIVDDIIDTCGTINNAYDALKIRGAKDVYICATHAVFSNGHLDKNIKGVIVTDTIEKDIEGVKVLSVANLIAQAIINL